MQNVLTHVSDRSSHLTGKRSKKQPKNFQRSVRGSYYTAISYDVIHDVICVLHLLKRKSSVILFDTLVSEQTFGLRLKFETSLSERQSDPMNIHK